MKLTVCDVCGRDGATGTIWWVEEPTLQDPWGGKRSKDLCLTCTSNVLHYMETLKP